MRNGATVLAVVPARGGSAALSRKNLVQVGGLSLVVRACRVAANLEWIDELVVSTDDAEIAEEVRDAGFDVPWLRPAELATDSSRSIDVWAHALAEAENRAGHTFEVSVLLEPTCPLRAADDVQRCVDGLVASGAQAAVTVSPSPPRFHPAKAISLSADGMIELPPGGRPQRRQELSPVYHTNGACYAARRRTVLELGEIMPPGTLGVVLDRPFVDIDTRLDVELAEWYLSRDWTSIRDGVAP